MEGKPEVLSWAEDIYIGFYECDRDFNGGLTFAGMNEVLNEYGVTDKLERASCRALWRSMESARHKRSKELKGG